MRFHDLQRLVDDKSVASYQQTCCKLIDKTCYPQAGYKLFQQVWKWQVAATLILTVLACCNLTKLTGLLQLVDNLQQVCGVLSCVASEILISTGKIDTLGL